MDRQTNGQGDFYRASAEFVWRGPNNRNSKTLTLQNHPKSEVSRPRYTDV